ncbi:loganic acid O-methyltransferase-like [Solanum verrucosum]|uniref:loganic acid O-methyltransferase-like n=1 Tax=Solanum verrucosum TaxID=315347 RepID=UPI0020D1C6DD|nr:loganic acid O-methyltransferase-like [Solanum verrucosum]
MTTSFPMNAGDGVYSYSKNSHLQKEMIDGAKEMVRHAIIRKLNIKIILSFPNTLRIAELGCSVGPNTFSAIQYNVEALKDKYLLYQDQVINFTNNIPEFQIFFNDHVTNDFNILFQSLPFDRSYYAYGIPGSFYGRLFPSRSMHFVHSSSVINWLSKIPKELVDEKSPAWNKGLIHYVGASNVEVVNAYFAQFEKDMEIFFNVRAEEIVQEGMMVLITTFSGYMRLMRFFGSSLMDLVNKGKLDESLVDSFNLPMYFPSVEDMTKVVEKNDCFSIEKIELTYPQSKLVDEADAKTLMIYRAVLGLLINHFGSEIAKEACERTILKSEEISAWMKANYEKSCQLFVALKRK